MPSSTRREGESYDYAGMDGYNWGTSRDWAKWKSFDEVFSPVYAYLLTLEQARNHLGIRVARRRR